jgi:hypothetical protein
MDGTYEGALEEYRALGADGVILPMDWDDDPHGEMAARIWFAKRARDADIDIYVSDVSTWDGSGKYPRSGAARERDGLPAEAIGVEGITYSELKYGDARFVGHDQ